MPRGKLLFSQIMLWLPLREFHRIVDKHKGDFNHKGFTCLDQFLAMAFAQLTFRNGLRGIEDTLKANAHCLYHMGFRCGTVARNTLAHANATRPWQIYAELALLLIGHAKKLYADEPLAVELKGTVFALDSTTIDLCLAQFPWCPSQQSKAAVKLHTLLNLRGNIPKFIVITGGKTHDVNILDQLAFTAGSYYIMDRGYLDFARLYHLHLAKALFVTRAKRKLKFRVVESHAVDKNSGLHCDQTIRTDGVQTTEAYPETLRRIKFRSPDTGKLLVFLTNDFSLPALLICELYKQRWQVELFFKWIKQHLKIKTFYGRTENAVRTQIWIAVAVYVLLAIIRKELKLDRQLHEIQEILSASVFQELPIQQAFMKHEPKDNEACSCNQMTLLDL
jgi:IS4 transposase